MSSSLKDKKVLLIGLGILGGGLNTAKWLLKHGARLTITDLKPQAKLAQPIRELKKYSNNIKFVLGEHREQDILQNEIIVVNPDVPLSSPFLRFAINHKKQIENELTLFYKYSANKQDIIAVTGTRGKTTTVNWIAHFLQSKFPGVSAIGNSPTNPLLKTSSARNSKNPAVIETPSFMLEHSLRAHFAPKIAIITNIYRDHLNRYGGMRHYALTKGVIFKDQTSTDTLILNFDNPWTKIFLAQKPKSHVLFFSTHALPKDKEGIFIRAGKVWIHAKHREIAVMRASEITERWGAHNLENFLASALAAHAYGVPIEIIKKQIITLPQISFREELVAAKNKIEIYNDTSATSPEAGIAACNRFKKMGRALFLITGGTDRNLTYKAWARAIKHTIKKENLVFLNGSATVKMKHALGWTGIPTFETLNECLEHALGMAEAAKKPTIILFSPAAKSFEKFKNEYDRGAQFNAIVKKLI